MKFNPRIPAVLPARIDSAVRLRVSEANLDRFKPVADLGKVLPDAVHVFGCLGRHVLQVVSFETPGKRCHLICKIY
jgi:hypothetical protein